MPAEPSSPNSSGLGALQRFVRRNAKEERCDLCGTGLPGDHEHLIEPATRKLVCACQACAILFSEQAGQRYKRVPRRIRFLPDFRITDGQWDSLMVPINMAFFYESSKAGRVIAVYPSPAGATESLLPLETWDQIVTENLELLSLQADVEGLLVNRLGPQHGFPVHQYYLLPIDECFKLVGLVRTNWHGLSGGDEMWRAMEQFFASLTARAGLGTERRYA
ncbi:MAG TPA: DUF5947 family protein [Bryobacteraceae bacterium]|nr:DUF5947 family protein [Bryobacteraceae bacterium]